MGAEKLRRVVSVVGRIGTLFFPFLLGGGMAFLMNTLLRPLEAQWGQAAAWKGARLKRLICLSLSAVIVVGPLFAVAFIMIPSLRASGNEFVRNVPAMSEEIDSGGRNVVQFAAKYQCRPAGISNRRRGAEPKNHRFYQLRRNRRVCRKRRKRKRFHCSDAA